MYKQAIEKLKTEAMNLDDVNGAEADALRAAAKLLALCDPDPEGSEPVGDAITSKAAIEGASAFALRQSYTTGIALISIPAENIRENDGPLVDLRDKMELPEGGRGVLQFVSLPADFSQGFRSVNPHVLAGLQMQLNRAAVSALVPEPAGEPQPA